LGSKIIKSHHLELVRCKWVMGFNSNGFGLKKNSLKLVYYANSEEPGVFAQNAKLLIQWTLIELILFTHLLKFQMFELLKHGVYLV